MYDVETLEFIRVNRLLCYTNENRAVYICNVPATYFHRIRVRRVVDNGIDLVLTSCLRCPIVETLRGKKLYKLIQKSA